MKPFGRNLFFLFILLNIICSCKFNASLVQSNEYEELYRHTFKNKKLNLIIPFAGDYKFENQNSRVKIPHYLLNKSPIVKHFWKHRITNLITARTTVFPYFNCYGFLLKKQQDGYYKNFDFEFVKKGILRSNPVVKDDFVLQNWIIKLDEYDLFLFSYGSLKKNNEDHTMESLVKSLNEEYNTIIDLITTDHETFELLPDPFQLASEKFYHVRSGDYFTPIQVLIKKEQVYLNSKIFKDGYVQAIASYLSIAGNKNLKEKYLLNWPYYAITKNQIPDSSTYHFTSDIDFLKKKLKENQVVMFNEAHYNPMHRLRLNELLPFLKEQGFKYLALEALNENSQETQVRGFPNLYSGFYTNEFQLANLIRRAISLGFTLINYDTETEDDRDLNQAQNLYNKTIKLDKDAKLVVLAGFDHILENSKSKKYMAEDFLKISGINPFTINQTRFNNSKTNSHLDSANIIILTDKNEDKNNDLYVLNNIIEQNSVLIDNRKLRSITIDLNLLGEKLNRNNLLQLFIEAEHKKDSTTSPCFSYFGDERKLLIAIPEGRYILKLQNSDLYKLKTLIVDKDKFLILEE
jgi:hypothetical protein